MLYPMTMNRDRTNDCPTDTSCAWWCSDKDNGYCAVTSIAIDLISIKDAITEVAFMTRHIEKL